MEKLQGYIFKKCYDREVSVCSGGWTWQANGGGEGSDDFDTQARAMQHVAGRNDQTNGGQVDIDLV